MIFTLRIFRCAAPQLMFDSVLIFYRQRQIASRHFIGYVHHSCVVTYEC